MYATVRMWETEGGEVVLGGARASTMCGCTGMYAWGYDRVHCASMPCGAAAAHAQALACLLYMPVHSDRRHRAATDGSPDPSTTTFSDPLLIGVDHR